MVPHKPNRRVNYRPRVFDSVVFPERLVKATFIPEREPRRDFGPLAGVAICLSTMAGTGWAIYCLVTYLWRG